MGGPGGGAETRRKISDKRQIVKEIYEMTFDEDKEKNAQDPAIKNPHEELSPEKKVIKMADISEIVFDTYVLCPICKKIMRSLGGSHLQRIHGFSNMKEFKLENGIPM